MKWSIPERLIEQGRSYMKENRVLAVNPNLTERVWYIEVLGSRLYKVKLDGTPREQDSCQCRYWADHGYCKHTVAAELYLKEQVGSRILSEETAGHFRTENREMQQAFLNDMGELFGMVMPFQARSRLALQIELELLSVRPNFYFKGEYVLGISLRAGTDKLYSVTKLADFLEQFHRQGEWEFRKGETISFRRTAMDEAAAAFLERLYRISQEVPGDISKYLTGISNRKIPSYLVLPPSHTEDFLHGLSKALVPYTLTTPEGTYAELLQVKQEPPFALLLSGEKGIRVTWPQEKHYYLKDYASVLKENRLYELDYEQEKLLDYLFFFARKYQLDRQVDFSAEDGSDLLTYALPVLEKVARIEVDESLQHKIVAEPLQTQLSFSGSREQIEGELRFVYKDRSPKDSVEDGQDVYVIRDVTGEEKMLALLEGFNFTITENRLLYDASQDIDLYRFLYRILPVLREAATVSLNEQLSGYLATLEKRSVAVFKDERDSFLNIRFDFNGISAEEIDELIASITRNELFYKTREGRIISLETEPAKEVNAFLSGLRKARLRKDGVLQVPLVQSLTLEKQINQGEGFTVADEEIDRLFHYIKQPGVYPAEIPVDLQASLRPYQIVGFRWLKFLAHYGLGGILADEMGLGKTLQVIAFILSEIQEGKNRGNPFLIVAPASLLYNWRNEFHKFAPGLKVAIMNGLKRERVSKIIGLEPDTIAITSYQSFRQDLAEYQEQQFYGLILDESQYVNNHQTKTYRALAKIDPNVSIALSGTPIENSVTELWSIFQLLLPGLYPKLPEFKQLSSQEISQLARPFMLRRLKADVLQDLPDKLESDVYSSLNKEQKALYLAYLKQLRQAVSRYSTDDFQSNRMQILAGLTRLRQICCDPRLINSDYDGGSGKLEQLIELVKNAKQENKHVLIFSQFTSMLVLIRQELENEHVSSFFLSGQTPAKDRIRMVDDFNTGKTDVFLISLKAGGTGLNLTGADTVILYDLWWNPAVEEQAAGRAHRIGQKNTVQVYRLIAEGTIEEQISELQQEKKMLFDEIIVAEDKAVARTRLTDEDIRKILGIS